MLVEVGSINSMILKIELIIYRKTRIPKRGKCVNENYRFFPLDTPESVIRIYLLLKYFWTNLIFISLHFFYKRR